MYTFLPFRADMRYRSYVTGATDASLRGGYVIPAMTVTTTPTAMVVRCDESRLFHSI